MSRKKAACNMSRGQSFAVPPISDFAVGVTQSAKAALQGIEMEKSFSAKIDPYPNILRRETDAPLSESIRHDEQRYGQLTNIATGGTCNIHSCKDNRLGRIVCRKSLRDKYADDPFEQQRFVREARVTAMLQHPSTLPVYDLSRDHDGRVFFTMKLIHGSTLHEAFEALRSEDAEAAADEWPQGRLLSVLLQACHALAFAHRHGVVHRDVKPGNILAGPFGEVTLLDWGLAKVWDDDADAVAPIQASKDLSLTESSGLRATPMYMSPEQASQSKDIDHRTDIYSVGAVLYEILTWHPLAWGETIWKMIMHTQYDAPPTPSERAPERQIPAELEDLCLRCIEKNPNDRFESIDHVVFALEQFLTS